ncbi:hypothetical protein [Metabacillus sp. 22489]|uniref:hypothetical protein n=1 Tax=Metabacillus sp. 22489 TaxID=3453928 RepID=UPI003F830980
MNIDWLTLGVNSAISLFLSFIMFSLGLRAGKERTDRKEVREKYRNLTIYFDEILKGFKDNVPKKWSDFYVKEVLTVRELDEKNELLELNYRLIKRLLHIELDSLKFGHVLYHDEAPKIGDILQDSLKEHDIEVKDGSYEYYTPGKIEPKPGRSIVLIQVNQLQWIFKDKSILEAINRNYDQNNVFYLDCRINTNKPNDKSNIKIYSTDFTKEQMIDFVDTVFKNVEQNIDIIDIYNKQSKLLKENQKIVKLLKKKTKEPYPFWNTVGNSITDLFK